MKKISIFSVFILSLFYYGLSYSQLALPVTFDNGSVTYVFGDFGGVSSSVVADPLNGSNNVGKTIKAPGAELWGGSSFGTAALASAIPFTSNNHSMTVRVYSPDAGIPVKLKVEVFGTPSLSVETNVNTTTANAWETLTFNFNSPSSGTAAFNSALAYNKASIFFNFGTDGNTAGTKTYYFEDLQMAPTPPLSQIDLPISFDDNTVDYSVTDFGGTATSLVADPTNASNTVARTIKGGSAFLWAGTTMSTTSLANPIPFTSSIRTMKVKVYSPNAGITVRLKIEVAGSSSQLVEVDATTTVANAWETLTFNFNNPASGSPLFNAGLAYNVASIFFNFGVDGATAGSKTYYWDDVQIGTPPALSQVDLPITFDASGVDYTVTDFGDNATTLVADPTNASNTVAQTVKPATAQSWAGTTMSTPIGLANIIPFTASNRVMKVKVYSPDAGIPVRLKVEVSSNGGQSVETQVLTTTSNAWETLTFDFNNNAAGTQAFNASFQYNKATIFFNFNVDGATAGSKTYLWDDVEMAAATTVPSLPISFETVGIVYATNDFDGGTTSVITNPHSTGINTSSKVLRMIKNAGNTWGGTILPISTTIDFSVNSVFKMKVYSPRVGCPILFKVENAAGNASEERTAVTTVANAWQELSWDFSGAASNIYEKLIFIYDNGVMGDGSSNFTFYQDDIRLVPQPLELPITFQSTSVNYLTGDFDGGTTTVMNNPFSNGINTSSKVLRMVKNAGQTYGGSTMTLTSTIDFSVNKVFRMKVYSPRTNCPIMFKIESPSGASAERTAVTTAANAWQELTWDFTGEASNVYNKLVFIYDNGTMGNGSSNFTFYQDDIELITPVVVITQIDLPVTFNSTTVNYSLTDFGGTSTVLGNDPTNASNKVAITTKGTSSQLWAGTTIGTNLGFLNTIPFTSSNRKIQMRVYSPQAGIPVKVKVEESGNGNHSVETEAYTTLVNTWETLTFDFNFQSNGTPAFNAAYNYNKLNVFYNFGTDGTTAGSRTYYCDDIQLGSINPLNDNCSNARTAPVNSGAANTLSTPVYLENATLAAGSPSVTIGTPSNDVYFKFTATSTSHRITLNTVNGMQMVAQVFAGSCAGSVVGTYNPAVNNNSQYFDINTTAGSTYYLRVFNFNGTSLTPPNSTASLSISRVPVANDLVCNATALATSTTGTPTYTVGTTVLSTTSSTAMSCGASNNDVWYSTVVPASGNVVASFNSTSALTNNMCAIYTSSDNTCSGTLTSVACNDNGGSGNLAYTYASNLTAGSTVFIRVAAVGTTDNSFGIALSDAMTWTGAASTDWSNTSNWFGTPDNAPSASSNVRIQKVTNQPTIITSTSVNDIAIQSGATITLNSVDLNISGNASMYGTTTPAYIRVKGTGVLNSTGNNNTISGVWLVDNFAKSNASTTTNLSANATALQIVGVYYPIAGTLTTNGKLSLVSSSTGSGASLVTTAGQIAVGSGIISGDVTIERKAPATTYAVQHFISSPISNANTVAQNYGDNFSVVGDYPFQLNNPAYPWLNPTVYPTTIWYDANSDSAAAYRWKSATNYVPAPGVGISAKMSGNTLFNVKGAPQTGVSDISVPTRVGRTNLVGNPYPSTIDLDLFLLDNASNVGGGTVYYLYNGSTSVSYSSAFGGTVVNNPFGDKRVRFMGHSTGFWVYGKPASSSIIFRNSQRNVSPQLTIAAASGSFFETSQSNVLHMRVKDAANAESFDETVIGSDANAADGIDDIDGNKFMVDATAATTPYIYTVADGQNLVINAMESTEGKVIPMGVITPKAGNFTIGVDNSDAFVDAASKLMLEDRAEGKFYNLQTNPTVMFNLPEGNVGSRFYLHVGSTAATTSVQTVATTSNINVYANSGKLFVNFGNELKGATTVEVFSLVGQRMINIDATSMQGLREVNTNNMAAGTYLVKVTNGENVTTQKVFIDKK